MPAAAGASRIKTRDAPNAPSSPSRDGTMQDIFWIGLTIGLTAATLAYARLCDHA